jgi:hypothetical protein
MKSIKALALVAFAAAALAVIPAAASASGGFVAGSYPATMHGSQLTDLSVSVGAGGVTCKTGEKPLTFAATLSKPSPSLATSSVTDPTCSGGSLETKGCQLEFHPGAGTFDIGPPGCGPIKLFRSGCVGSPYLVPSQTGIPAGYVNSGSGTEANVHITLKGEGLENTNPEGLCKFSGTHKDLKISGELKMAATDAKGNPIGTSAVSGGLSLGLFFAGGPEAGEGEPRLAATEYPVRLTGERFFDEPFIGQITLFEYNGVKVSCPTAELEGGELAGPQYTEFNLNAKYSGCTLNKHETTVAMRSCHYRFSNFEPAVLSEYRSVAAISCSKEGDKISLSAAGCTLEFPAQTLSGETGISNIPEGYNSTVVAMMSATGVHYTKTPGCEVLYFGKGLNGENGILHSDMLLHGIYPG